MRRIRKARLGGRRVLGSERSGPPIRRLDETPSHPRILLPTRANRGVSRPALAAPVPPRTYERIERRTLFPGVLAPMPITCALRRWQLPPSDRLATPRRRSLARLGVLAPMPITLRPAAMATAPFGQIGCSPAPGATRRTCAHANHLRPAAMATGPFGQIGCSSAPVAPGATRRACAHANHLRPAGLVLGGAM